MDHYCLGEAGVSLGRAETANVSDGPLVRNVAGRLGFLCYGHAHDGKTRDLRQTPVENDR